MTLAQIVTVGLPLALFSIMFAMGLTLRAADFSRLRRQPRAVAVGLGAQLLLLPLLAVALVWLFAPPAPLALGLLILSFCPGGTTSNLFSHLARADLALSISLTALASVITPFSIPLLTHAALQAYGDSAVALDFPVLASMARLAAVTLLPVAAGMLLRVRAPIFAARWQPRLQRLAVLLFVAVIVALIARDWGELPRLLAHSGGLCALMIGAALALGYAVARLAHLPAAQRITITLEVGLQNGGTALLVTQGVLASAAMSVVPVMYGLLMLLPAITLSLACRRRAVAVLAR